MDLLDPSPNVSRPDLRPPLRGKQAGKPHLFDAGKEDGSSAGVGSTVAGSALAAEDHYDEDGDSIIGRWITEEEDFVTFDLPRYSVDMSSFGPGGRGFECLKQDSQKADDAEVPTYMWDLKCCYS